MNEMNLREQRQNREPWGGGGEVKKVCGIEEKFTTSSETLGKTLFTSVLVALSLKFFLVILQ